LERQQFSRRFRLGEVRVQHRQPAGRAGAGQSEYITAPSLAAANSWQIGPEGPNSADAFCCGQTYIDLYRLNPQPDDLADISSRVNAWMLHRDEPVVLDRRVLHGRADVCAHGQFAGDTNYLQKLCRCTPT